MSRSLTTHACLALAALSITTGPSEAASQLTIEQIKAVYLECENQALMAELPAPDAIGCSMTYEELKQRAFNGDFRQLHEWWMAQKAGSSVEEDGRVGDAALPGAGAQPSSRW